MAGGGTAGHVSPMLASAEALNREAPGVQISCVGTPVGLENTLVPQCGFELDLIDPVPLPRSLSGELISLPWRVWKAVGQAKAILRDRQAEVVAGFGGYASLPVCLAARQLRIPVVVHEANSVPGLANRLAARFAAQILVTFANTGLPGQRVVGMPVRQAVATLDRAQCRRAARAGFGLPETGVVLLVSGGSQGARRLNQAVVAALADLDQAGISVLHATGMAQFDEAIELPELTRSAYVRLPYIDRMEEAYAAADLMVARSGAATVCETAIVGLPCVFVPLPHGNGEQAKNAAGLVEAGAGRLVDDSDLTKQRLVEEVQALTADPAKLTRMGAAAQQLMPRDSAMIVAQAVLEVGRNGQARL